MLSRRLNPRRWPFSEERAVTTVNWPFYLFGRIKGCMKRKLNRVQRASCPGFAHVAFGVTPQNKYHTITTVTDSSCAIPSKRY